MTEIWKYTLEVAGVQRIKMPEKAKILCVQVQHGQPCIWVMVNPQNDKETRCVWTVGTGHDATHLSRCDHIGTYQLQSGNLVFHVFALALSEALDEPGEEKPLKDLYGANVEWGGGAKCVLCGSPMPDNEIRCRRCHP